MANAERDRSVVRKLKVGAVTAPWSTIGSGGPPELRGGDELWGGAWRVTDDQRT